MSIFVIVSLSAMVTVPPVFLLRRIPLNLTGFSLTVTLSFVF